MRILSSSSSDDGEVGFDNDDNDGGDDNDESNNSADGGTYSLEGHMQMLSLTSGQYYGVTYVITTDHNLRDLRALVFVYLHTAEMIMMMILYFFSIQCGNNYISMYLWM